MKTFATGDFLLNIIYLYRMAIKTVAHILLSKEVQAIWLFTIHSVPLRSHHKLSRRKRRDFYTPTG